MTGALDQVPSAFRAALAAAAGQLCREGSLSDCENGEELLAAEDDGRHLQLVVRKGTIVGAVHRGAADPAERAVLDVFCQILEGLPMQEAADHAGHHLVARLRDPDEPAPVPGILTPWNADPLFRRALRLVRRAHADRAARQAAGSRENFWNPAISRDWLRLGELEQMARVEEVLTAFRAEQDLQDGDLVVVGVENNIRVLLAFAGEVGYGRKPGLLMAFEARLRAATGDRLEVFAEEMKDDNRIRRL